MTYLMFVAGLAGLYFGGEWLVRGASGVARIFRVPPLVIGLLLVGFGTSMPELMVSVDAALSGAPQIAVGNVVGSNIANILLILGTAAALGALPAPAFFLWRSFAWMLAAALVLVPVFIGGRIDRLEGLALLLGLGIYLWRALTRAGKHRSDESEEPEEAPGTLPFAVLAALLGLAGVLIGAQLLVDSASEIARRFGVSEAVIGLTVVAIGTSLPELASTLAAAMRNQRDIALGNVIGSNIFNSFAILGTTALVAPIPVDPRFLYFDVPVLVLATLGVWALSLTLGRLPRAAGFGALALYAGYLALSAVPG